MIGVRKHVEIAVLTAFSISSQTDLRNLRKVNDFFIYYSFKLAGFFFLPDLKIALKSSVTSSALSDAWKIGVSVFNHGVTISTRDDVT